MEGLGLFFAVIVLAWVVEAILEYIFGIWWKPFSEELRPKVLMAVGLVLGVAVALLYRIDLIAYIGQIFNISELQQPVVEVLGRVLTGLLIGRGSEFLHGFWKKIKP